MATSSAQFTSEFSNPNLDILISKEQIRDRIKELGAQITRDYAGLNPLLIGVLKGACFFLSDLMRAIDMPVAIELGHKLARRALAPDTRVLKYGAPIGSMKVAVARGEHVHLHNLRSDYLPSTSREIDADSKTDRDSH